MINWQRYQSQMIIPGIGAEGQVKIAAARVLVIGAGGLGCPVLSSLAGMGIGHIGIVDDDIVAMNNLHRQLLYNEEDIGKPKSLLTKQKLQAQNSEINITAFNVRLSEANAATLINDFDIVIDCCDNAPTRYIIDQFTKAQEKPFVYAGVKQWEGQCAVFNYKQGPSYKNLFPDEEAAAAEIDCAVAGIIAPVTAILGNLQVSEVVKIILGDEKNILSGILLSVDLLNLQWRKLKISSY